MVTTHPANRSGHAGALDPPTGGEKCGALQSRGESNERPVV